MIAYHKEDYSKAVDLMMPVRYNVVELGGSDAQVSLICQYIYDASQIQVNLGGSDAQGNLYNIP